MIVLNVCLSDIPADKRFKGKDGKIYTNIIATELKAPDKFDNTHTVYMSQSKEEREAKADKQYIGRGKEVVYGGSKPAQQEAPAKEGNPDLPF